MSSQNKEAKSAPSRDQQVVYGQPRPKGAAGPEADYILKTVGRWRLRGDGYLSMKK